MTLPMHDTDPTEKSKTSRIRLEVLILILPSTMSGTDSKAKSKMICKTLKARPYSLALRQCVGGLAALPNPRKPHCVNGGLHLKTSPKTKARMKHDIKPSMTLWQIIQPRDLSPVRRRLKRQMDILTKAAAT